MIKTMMIKVEIISGYHILNAPNYIQQAGRLATSVITYRVRKIYRAICRLY